MSKSNNLTIISKSPHFPQIVYKFIVSHAYLFSDSSINDDVQDVSTNYGEDEINLSMTSSNNSSQTLAPKDIASSIGTPEDRKAYRQYRVRKTKNCCTQSYCTTT